MTSGEAPKDALQKGGETKVEPLNLLNSPLGRFTKPDALFGASLVDYSPVQAVTLNKALTLHHTPRKYHSTLAGVHCCGCLHCRPPLSVRLLPPHVPPTCDQVFSVGVCMYHMLRPDGLGDQTKAEVLGKGGDSSADCCPGAAVVVVILSVGRFLVVTQHWMF